MRALVLTLDALFDGRYTTPRLNSLIAKLQAADEAKQKVDHIVVFALPLLVLGSAVSSNHVSCSTVLS